MVKTLFINFSDAQGQLTLKSVMESCRSSNSCELLWLSLLSARMKIHPKMKVLEWSQHFSHYKSMGIFPEAQGQLTHKCLSPMLLNLEPIRDFMVVRVTCKNNKEQINKSTTSTA